MPAGHEYQSAGLMLDESFEQPAVLCSELSLFDSHVTEKNDIVFSQLVEARGELLDVVLVARAYLAEARMVQQARQGNTRIARQGVAQIAIFPARNRFDEQHAKLFLADSDRRGELIVFREQLIGLIESDAKVMDERETITDYVRSLGVGRPLDERAVREGYQQVKAEQVAEHQTVEVDPRFVPLPPEGS